MNRILRQWTLPVIWIALIVSACSPSISPTPVSSIATQSAGTATAGTPSLKTPVLLPSPTTLSTPITLTSATVPLPSPTIRQSTPSSTPASEYPIVEADRTSVEVSPEITDWLQNNSLILSTIQPGDNMTDLAPLKEIIGDADVVILGESTHGAHEFFEIKHRLFRFLAEDMGFTVLAVEDGLSPSLNINQWVHGGSNDLQSAIANMQWNISTSEMVDLIEWMRDYNVTREVEGQLSYYGFDLADPHLDLEAVRAYIRKVDPNSIEKFNSWFACMPVYSSAIAAYRAQSAEEKDSCRNNLMEAYNYILAQRSSYEILSSPKDWAYALRITHNLLQVERSYSLQDRTEFNSLRQQYMVDNISWIVSQVEVNERIVLWTHNGHGSELDRDLSALENLDVVSFGLTFYEGEFLAFGRDQQGQLDGQLLPRRAFLPPSDSYEHYFQSAGIPRFILNLQSISPRSEATEWLYQHHALRAVGCCYNYEDPDFHFSYRPILSEEFDLVIFIDQVSPSHVLGNVSP